MNKRHLIFLIIILVNASTCFSQQKETLESDGIKKKLTISENGMYSSSGSETAKQHFDDAQGYEKNKDYKNAKKSYLKAIKEDSNFIEAYDNLGLICRRLKSYDEAIEYYKKSIELFSDGQNAHQNIAVVYSIKKEYKNAINSYRKLVNISPDNPEGYFGIANSYMMLTKFTEALSNAEKALDLYEKMNSNHLGDGYYLIGLIHFYSGNDELAKEHLEKAIDYGTEINPEIEKKIFGNFSISYRDIKLEKSEDYKINEAQFIKGYKWLFETPLNETPDKRKEINKFLLDWSMGSPYISIELNEKIINYTEHSDCLMIFIGGWVSNALENELYDNKFEGSLFGTESVIKFYEANKDNLGEIKEIEKLKKLKKKNKLKEYIKSNV